MIVLVADSISQVGLDALESAGHTVHSQPKLSGDTLVSALEAHRPQALIVRSTKVTPEALDASPHLGLIVRAGAGYDTIDVAGASDRGIYVANCPGKNSVAVAELTLGLALAIDRRIPDNVIDARDGVWNKKTYAQADGLKGRTFGVIGLGNIGHAVVERAKAFGMDVVAWSRSLTPEETDALGIGYRLSPAAVAADADIVSLHVASTPETKNLADRAFFESMQDGATFLNTTRAAVVDEDALTWALEKKGIYAGLDVVAGEPSAKEGAFSHPLQDHPQVYITHHIGASTQQAQDATATEAARVVTTYDETGDVPNCVNLATQTEASYQLTVRHLDKVGVLAGVLGEMSRLEWNIQEMENQIFAGGEAAVAVIRFDGSVSDDSDLDGIRDQKHVLAVDVIPQ